MRAGKLLFKANMAELEATQLRDQRLDRKPANGISRVL